MEAKDTVIPLTEDENQLLSWYEQKYLSSVRAAQAEISFKAGQENPSVTVEMDILEQGYQAGHTAGIKEVVEWIIIILAYQN